jgi:hypothetical protein
LRGLPENAQEEPDDRGHFSRTPAALPPALARSKVANIRGHYSDLTRIS